MRAPEPRIAPVDPAALDDDGRALLDLTRLPGVPASNIFATLIRHRGLFRRWLPFSGKLLAGRIPARERELVVLRTGWVCDAEYEWSQLVVLARQAGVSDAEVERVASGPDAPGWTPHEAALLRAVDELHATSDVSDRTWGQLAERYDDAQLIELVALVGQYHLVAFATNALRVQLEPGAEGYSAAVRARR